MIESAVAITTVDLIRDAKNEGEGGAVKSGVKIEANKKALRAETVRALYLLVGARGFEPLTTCTPYR